MDLNDYKNSLSNKVAKEGARRKRMQSDTARFTTILHAARRKLDITINEYVLADIIHKLSGNRGSVPGWCYASKEYLGEQIGITRQGAQKIIDRLITRGLVEADPQTNYLRTTETWYFAVEAEKKKVFGQ